MKSKIILYVLSITVISCGESNIRKQTTIINNTQSIQDTIIVKEIDDVGLIFQNIFSLYSYTWLVGKDTLDFALTVLELKEDNTFDLRIHHGEPILFSNVLEKIEECFPLIEEDFNLSKLRSISFREPIYYLDLAQRLSSEYEQKFGRKIIEYEKLNPFLLKTSFTLQLDSFLNLLNKKVQSYEIEKFDLIEKKYYEMYLYFNESRTYIDFSEYPEFTITGMEVYVELENK